jgi:eukaryotic-like serine/threonine-protein kinase
MGVVYVAYDPQLDRKVALKVLRPDVSSASTRYEYQARMMREAQAMARLSHPNVVAVHDVGTTNNSVFVAMDLVEGPTLERWLKAKKRPWREILRVLIGAGRGLAAAHGAGILHRDFKPNNVVIANDETARVTDFGLARTTGEKSSEPHPRTLTDEVRTDPTALDTELTPTGVFVGTPEYTAPEQVAGAVIDARADQFSFCVTLYEALYGEHPFAGRTAAQVVHRIAYGQIRPPSNSRIPSWIRRALLRGMAVRPEERWPSMEALLDALSRDPRAHWPRWAVGAAVLSLVAGGIAAGRLSIANQERRCRTAGEKLSSVWNADLKRSIHDAFQHTGAPFAEGSWSNTEQALDAYAWSWISMRTDACEATQVRGEQSEETLDLRIECLDRRLAEFSALADLLTSADTKTVEQSVAAAHALSSIADCADTKALRTVVRAPTDPGAVAQLAEVRRSLARAKAFQDSGKYREGLPVAQSSVAGAKAVDYAPVIAESLVRLADLQDKSGDTRGAEASAREAVAAAQRGHDDALTADAWDQLAFTVGDEGGHYDEGRWYTQLAEAAVARFGGQDEIEGELLQIRGNIDADQGHYDEAIRELEASLSLREKARGPNDPQVALALSSLGNARFGKGDIDQAIALHQRVLDIRRKLLDPKHPSIGVALQNMGEDWSRKGDNARAVEFHERALALFQESLGPTHTYVGVALANLGRDLGRMGSYARALETEQRGMAILERKFGPDSAPVAEALEYLGEIQLANGKPLDALAAYQRALGIREKSTDPTSADRATALAGIGLAELRLHGRTSIAPLEKAVSLKDASRLNPLGLANAQFALAQALWGGGGSRERARSLALEALHAYQGAAVSQSGGTQAAEWLRQHGEAPASPSHGRLAKSPRGG